MSIISGNDVTYNGQEFVGSSGNIIERTGITIDSQDFTPTASQITAEFGGASGINEFFEVFILNSSNTFTITLNPNTGMTMKPGPTDTIRPGTIKRYTIILTSATTCDIYNLDYNGTPLVIETVFTNTIEKATTSQTARVYENDDDVIVNTTQIELENSINTNNKINFFASTNLTGSYDLIFPGSSGNVGQILQLNSI
jgi:hypothetical protein